MGHDNARTPWFSGAESAQRGRWAIWRASPSRDPNSIPLRAYPVMYRGHNPSNIPIPSCLGSNHIRYIPPIAGKPHKLKLATEEDHHKHSATRCSRGSLRVARWRFRERTMLPRPLPRAHTLEVGSAGAFALESPFGNQDITSTGLARRVDPILQFCACQVRIEEGPPSRLGLLPSPVPGKGPGGADHS